MSASQTDDGPSVTGAHSAPGPSGASSASRGQGSDRPAARSGGGSTSAADRRDAQSRPAVPPSPYSKSAPAAPAAAQATKTQVATAHAGTTQTGTPQTGTPQTAATQVDAAAEPPASASSTPLAAEPATGADWAGGSAVTPMPRRRVRDLDGSGQSSVPPSTTGRMSDPDWDGPEDPPMIRTREQRPRIGWRALGYDVTRGHWNPGMSEKERRIRERERQIARQLRGKHVTAFFCLKGGISKTSTTAATSIAMANLRPDPVFAIDANPDAGDLAERLVGRSHAGITELSRRVETIGSLDDLSRYTLTAGRLTMLPGEPNPELGDSLSALDFRRIMGVVQRYYNVVQVDCGTGVTHPLMRGILEFADTVVIPASWSITGAKRAAESIEWLASHGFAHLANTCIVVLTAKDLVSRSVDKDAVRAHLAQAADLIVVPSDPHVADGSLIDWEQLGPRTREAYLDIAAAITRRFPEGGWPSIEARETRETSETRETRETRETSE